MSGPWIPDATLEEDVAASMMLDSTSLLGSRWTDTIIPAANIAAAADLTAFLCGLGYTTAQVDAWDDRVEANRRLGLLYALQRGNPLGKIDADMAKNLDPREPIRQQGSVNISGVPTSPTAASSQVGGIVSGQVAAFASLTSNRYPRCGWC